MFRSKDNYSYELIDMCARIRLPWDNRPYRLPFFDEFKGKTYCLLQRINGGYRPDNWDETHGGVRGEMITRILDFQLPELSNRALNAFINESGCFLRLQDPNGNAYEAMRITKSIDMDLRVFFFHIRLSDELREKLEKDSYYPYSGPLLTIVGSNKDWPNTKEEIKVTMLDDLQAMEAMERMRKYRDESEKRQKKDEENEAAKRRYLEEEKLAEQARQRDYDARKAAVDQNKLDQMFRSSSK